MAAFMPKILLLVFVVEPIVAWGPRFEPMKGSYGATSLLKASEQEHQEREPYTLHSEETDTNVDGERFQSRMFISSPLLWEPIGNDYVHSFFGEDHVSCGEDDCEDECLIPEEYKIAAQEETVDVMAFLGIKRAEPLRTVPYARDWE